MNNSKFTFLLFGVVLLSCNTTKKAVDTKTSNEKPLNIVLIVADDLGWSDLGCYGNKFMETPNLDALAKKGIRFTQGYAAAPLCSPTRASIITGNNPARINFTEHLHGYSAPTVKQKIIPPTIVKGLPVDLLTIPQALKTAGYYTGHIGKWHLGEGESSPAARGFDFVYGGGPQGLAKTHFYPFFWGNPYPSLIEDTKPGDYLADALTNKTLIFIDKHKAKNFFVELNFYSPHVPIEGPSNLVKKYDVKRAKTNHQGLPEDEYAAMVDNLDHNVGRLLSYLKANHLDKNTLILFTSDNGGLTVEEVPAFAKHTPPTTNAPLKGGKGTIYEGGIREPYILYHPGIKVQNHLDSTTVITSDDIFDTFMDVAGVNTKSPDGMSILKNRTQNNPNRPYYLHFPHYSPQHGLPGDAIRIGDYKLIVWYETGESELFNLKNDIGEKNDIALKYPAKVAELKQKLMQWKKDVGAKEPTLNPNYSK